MLGTLVAGGAVPASAQLSGSLGIASDERLRGHDLSAGRPVAAATLAYDSPGGVYVDGALTVAATRGPVAAIDESIDAGYAWRRANAVAIDVGVTRRHFTRYASGGRATGYDEVYAGVSGRGLSARLHYSPDYLATGNHTLYASLDGALRPAADWRITAHAGAIAYLSPIRVPMLRPIDYDADLGLGRRLGSVELRLDLSFGGPDGDRYGGRTHARTALVAGAAIVF